MKIFIVAGKARNGKDSICSFIKDYYNEQGKKVINVAYGDYIKEFAKKIIDWDGNEDSKPRTLLQNLGDLIKGELGADIFTNRLCEDIKIYAHYCDVITISSVRFPEEIDIPKEVFDNVYSIHVIRPGFNNGLTSVQSNHKSETSLDNYNKFDFTIFNNEDLDSLKEKVYKVVEEVDYES